MKKNLLFIAAILLFITSCADKDSYTVKGKISNADYDGLNVFLQEMNKDQFRFNTIDTGRIENGTFTFKEKIGDTPLVRFISIGNTRQPLATAFFIAERGKIDISIDTITPVIKGTPLNDAYQQFSDKANEHSQKLYELDKKYMSLAENGSLTPEDEEQISAEFDTHSKELENILFDYVKSNMQSEIGEFLFLSAGNSFDDNQVKELIGLANPQFKERRDIKELELYLSSMGNSMLDKMYIDVKGNTPEGKEIALSDYAGKGKIVLVDFWASWCKPCINEMPVIIEAYNKFKSKGFEIVGISLDEDKAKWQQCIKDLGITWPQMSDLKGWESELSAPYKVESIPYTLLLGRDGNVIAERLDGHELLEVLDKLLN